MSAAEQLRRIKSSQALPHYYLFERDPSGHRITYMSMVVRYLDSVSANYTLLVSDSVLQALKTLVPAHPAGRRVRLIANHYSLQDVFRNCDFDRSTLVILDGDPYLIQAIRASLRHPGVSIRLLIMQDPKWIITSFRDYGPRQVARNIAKLAALNTARLFLKNLELRFLTYPRPALGPYSIPPGQIEDPVLVETLPARIPNRPHLSDAVTWLGIVGAISARKHPELLISAIELLEPEEATGIGVALLGPTTSEVAAEIPRLRSRLSRLGIELVVDSRPRTNEQMNADVRDLDIICMLYSTSAPNSTAAKAGFYGRKILAAGPGKYREFVTLMTGAETSILQALPVATLLRKILTDDPPQSLIYTSGESFPIEVLAG